MPGTDFSSYANMLKDTFHREAILNSLNDENPILGMMTEQTVEASFQGDKYLIPKRVGRNWSIGSIPRRGALPQQGRSVFLRSEIDIRNVYMRVGWDKEVMIRSRNNKGAWEEAMALEMEAGVDDFAFRRNIMAWGTGSGILAKVNGVHAAATTIELKDPGNVTGTILANRYIHGDLLGGMFLAFLDGVTPTIIKGVANVTGINADGTDITVDTPLTLANNDLVVTAQTLTQNSFNQEPEGLLAAVDDGTFVANYHNINRATTPAERAFVVAGVGPLSMDAIQQAIDGVSIRVGKTVDLFGSEHAVGRAYLAITETDRRYTGANLMRPDGGTSRAKNPSGQKAGITYGDIPWLFERDCPFGMLFGFKKDTFLRLVGEASGWADDEGSVLKWVDGFDEYTAFYRLWENYHCMVEPRNFRMDGITTTQVLAHSL